MNPLKPMGRDSSATVQPQCYIPPQLTRMLDLEEGGRMTTVWIDNGKSPDEPYNARLGFWLPPDSPRMGTSLSS